MVPQELSPGLRYSPGLFVYHDDACTESLLAFFPAERFKLGLGFGICPLGFAHGVDNHGDSHKNERTDDENTHIHGRTAYGDLTGRNKAEDKCRNTAQQADTGYHPHTQITAGHTESALHLRLFVAQVNGSGHARVQSAQSGAFGAELGMGLAVPIGAESGTMFLDGSVLLRSHESEFHATVGYRIRF